MNLCSIRNDFMHYFIVTILILLLIEYGPELKIKRKYLLIILGLLLVYIIKQTFIKENFEQEIVKQSKIEENPELSDVEIISHVQNIIKNINNKENLSKLEDILNKDNSPKKSNLLKILKVTKLNPVLMSRLATISPKKLMEFADLISKSPDPIPEENNVVQTLTKRINELESMVNKNPAFLQKLIQEGKYEDKDGQIRDLPYGDMMYSQVSPSQMQPPVRKGDDDWDTTGYMLVDSHRWFGSNPNPNKDLYEEKCPVCPMMTKGYPTNLMEFDTSRYVISADDINIDYIKKLNTKKL